jgi:hypothetical protein
VGLWVGQQVPDDDQDGSANRDDGPPLAASTGDPPVAFPKEAIGLAGGHGSLAEHRASYGLPCPVDLLPLGLPAAG